MKIISKNGNEYEVRWRTTSWSFANAHVFIRVKFLWFKRLKHVWEGTQRYLFEAEKMLPKDMVYWFEQSVEEYENYKISWENYNEKSQN